MKHKHKLTTFAPVNQLHPVRHVTHYLADLYLSILSHILGLFTSKPRIFSSSTFFLILIPPLFTLSHEKQINLLFWGGILIAHLDDLCFPLPFHFHTGNYRGSSLILVKLFLS